MTEQTPPKIFNGKITIENTLSGEYRTFLIRTQKPDAKFAPGRRIISLLIGPDNLSHYSAFGFVSDSGVDVWSKFRGELCKPSAHEWFGDMVGVVVAKLPSRYGKTYEHYTAHVEGRCIKCNRTLTTPDSIRTGIGPVCAQGGIDS